MKECSAALEATPSSSKALRSRAKALEKQGLYKQALADVQVRFSGGDGVLFASCVGVCWCVFVGEGGGMEIGLHQQALPNIQVLYSVVVVVAGGGGGLRQQQQGAAQQGLGTGEAGIVQTGAG